MSSPARISPVPPASDVLEVPVRMLESVIQQVTPESLPAIAGELGRLSALVSLRIVGAAKPPVEVEDRWLETAEAAQRMGFSRSWLYGHKSEYAFCRKIGGRYRFSEKGMMEYLRLKRRGA